MHLNLDSMALHIAIFRGGFNLNHQAAF